MKNSLFLTLLVFFLVACTQYEPQDEPKQISLPVQQNIRLFAAPPDIIALNQKDMKSQAIGAFTMLRQQAVDNATSLDNCTIIKAFLRTGEDEPTDITGFQAAFDRFFGTRLVPNQPKLVQIQVSGFATPAQLVLIEAECTSKTG